MRSLAGALIRSECAESITPTRGGPGLRIRIAGGADVIQQYLNLGVIDELEIALAPVLFGDGRRLFENLREPAPRFRIDKVLDTPAATHLRYVRD